MRHVVLQILALVLAGCAASNVPLEIREPLPNSPDIGAASAGAEHLKGAKVRWGGKVLSVQNNPDDSALEILATELGSYGRPKDTDRSQGRFIARVPGFIDPAVYTDREVTVYGTLEGAEERKIGEKPYNYPKVRVEKLYLWAEYEDYPYPPYPPYYDPFYYPYYPHRWGYWPYFPYW